MCSDANLVRSWDFHSLGREYAYKWREQPNRKLCFSFRRILEMNMNFRFYFDAGYWFLVRMTCHFKSDFHRTKNIQRAKKKSVEYSMNIYSVEIEIEIQINPSSGRTRKCNPKRWNMYHRSHLNRLDVFSVFAIFCRKMPFSVQRETKRHTNTKQKPHCMFGRASSTKCPLHLSWAYHLEMINDLQTLLFEQSLHCSNAKKSLEPKPAIV